MSHLEDKQLYYVTTLNDLRGKSLYNKIVQAAAEERRQLERSMAALNRRKTAGSFHSTPPLVDKSNDRTPLSNRRRMSFEGRLSCPVLSCLSLPYFFLIVTTFARCAYIQCHL